MRRWFSMGFLGAGLLAALAGSPQALAQDRELRPLLDRMERLERDIRTLNVQVSRGVQLSRGGKGAVSGAAAVNPSFSQAIARMEVRWTELEGELRAATGKSEEVSFQLEQINQRLDKLIGDVDYRLSSLEKARSAMPEAAAQAEQASGEPRLSAAPSPPAVQTGAPGEGGSFAAQPGTLGTISESDLKSIRKPEEGAETSQPAPQQAESSEPAQPTTQTAQAAAGVLPQGTPRERYTHAFKLLRQANYDEAEAALREFLELHGDDPLASNARYWLGETFYVREDFRTAAQIFIEGFQKSPKSSKAADTLLKLGMSLAKLDKKNEACAAFGKLLSDFPKVPANIGKLVTKERQNNGCK